MEGNYNNMNNNINIFFYAIVKDINGQFFKKEFKVISKPTETVGSLIALFFKSSKLCPYIYSCYFSEKNLARYETFNLEQIGIINNSKIDVVYVEFDDPDPFEYEIEDINILA